MIKAFETIDSAIIEYIENSHERCVVMILSDENYDLRGLDSNVYAAVIKLQKIIKKIPSLKIIVELLDPINHDIIADFNVENTIVSNRLISLLITQLATNPQKYDFLEKLIEIKVDDNEVFDIKIGKVADMIDKSNLDFNSNAELVSSYYYSSGAKRILIGTNINNEIKYFSNNLDSNNIKLNLEDELIYIQY